MHNTARLKRCCFVETMMNLPLLGSWLKIIDCEALVDSHVDGPCGRTKAVGVRKQRVLGIVRAERVHRRRALAVEPARLGRRANVPQFGAGKLHLPAAGAKHVLVVVARRESGNGSPRPSDVMFENKGD